jgi:uncharacterized protein YcbX
MTTSVEAGTAVSLWRYPVKSMLGEELNASEVTERGLLGDRAFALLDRAEGKVASAKNPRKWPGLFDFRAAYAEPPRGDRRLPPVRITLPDGRSALSGGADLAALLSAAIGRDVELRAEAPERPELEEYWPDVEGLAHREAVTVEAMPPGTFFDFAPVHVLTTATLRRLQELYPEGRFEARRFRPNLIVEAGGGASGFVENDWIGRTLAIGEEVRLRVTDPCGRCVMTTLAQADLPKDPGVLRVAAKYNRAAVGVYAQVERGGTIHRGDPVRLE